MLERPQVSRARVPARPPAPAAAEARLRATGLQAAAVVAVLAGTLAAGGDVRAVAAATGAVLLGLAFVAVSASAERRAAALALLAAGDRQPALRAVRRERARLERPHHARRLAAALDALRAEARRPCRDRPLGRPLYRPAVVVAVDAQLARVAVLLRGPAPAVAAIARAELLLGSASSPLYEDDAGALREELGALLFLLEQAPP